MVEAQLASAFSVKEGGRIGGSDEGEISGLVHGMWEQSWSVSRRTEAVVDTEADNMRGLQSAVWMVGSNDEADPLFEDVGASDGPGAIDRTELTLESSGGA